MRAFRLSMNDDTCFVFLYHRSSEKGCVRVNNSFTSVISSLFFFFKRCQTRGSMLTFWYHQKDTEERSKAKFILLEVTPVVNIKVLYVFLKACPQGKSARAGMECLIACIALTHTRSIESMSQRVAFHSSISSNLRNVRKCVRRGMR